MANSFGSAPIPGSAQLQPQTTYLVLLNGPKANNFFLLNRMRSLLGRSHPPYMTVDIDLTGCELNHPPTISRHHAVIQWANQKLQIMDLASRNGTFVNGRQLVPPRDNGPSEPVALRAGSKIQLGALELAIVVAGG